MRGLLPVSHTGKGPDPCEVSLGPWVGGVVSLAELPVRSCHPPADGPNHTQKSSSFGGWDNDSSLLVSVSGQSAGLLLTTGH